MKDPIEIPKVVDLVDISVFVVCAFAVVVLVVVVVDNEVVSEVNKYWNVDAYFIRSYIINPPLV